MFEVGTAFDAVVVVDAIVTIDPSSMPSERECPELMLSTQVVEDVRKRLCVGRVSKSKDNSKFEVD